MDTLCLQFINSEFRDFRGRWMRDDLQQPGWLENFLAQWDLQIAIPPDEAALTALVKLRVFLRHLLEALAGGQISDEQLAELNTILLKTPLQRHLEKDGEGYRLEMAPLQKDWDWVQAEIAASFVHLLTDHDARRLKLCANPHCRGAFYDDSKSRTQRYCTADKCANLMKARRYRARRQRGAFGSNQLRNILTNKN
jgi:predicted RNA-binding Zn ribbon-like protein